MPPARLIPSGDEQVAQVSRPKVPETLEDARTSRDIVVQLKSMEARVKESEVKVNDMRVELAVTKVHVEQLQKENAGKASLRLHSKVLQSSSHGTR